MKRNNIRKTASIALAAVLALSAGCIAFADDSQTAIDMKGPGMFGGQMGGSSNGTTGNVSSPTEVVTSTLTENSAEDLTADYANATTIVMSESNDNVKISASGTYIVTGSCSNGNLAVKKGTTGVVLILKDLDLTSTVGAAVSLNKGTEVKVIIEGTVKLTDAEDIADEESDDFDGAALKAKVGSSVVLTGTGTLVINGSCKNGIKVSSLDADDINDGYSEASFIIDGEDLTIKVTAENDGINSGSDLTIKSGTITVSAGDDGVKADYILTIGENGTAGPTITVSKSVEGIEGATVNIYSGNISVTASDDGINAANSDLTDYTYSLNIMGGNTNVSSGADGIDSNGNVNIIGGLTTILKSASNGGEGGLDYEGSCYIAEGCLVNPYGTTMDSGNGGFGQRGQMNGQQGQTGSNGQFGQRGQMNWNQDQQSQTGGQTPDMSSGATENSQFGQMGPKGQMGQMGGNGQMGPKGQMGQMNGSDQFGQQPPEMNGERPDFSGQQPPEMNSDDTELPENIEITDTTKTTNWFESLIQTIKSWFNTVLK